MFDGFWVWLIIFGWFFGGLGGSLWLKGDQVVEKESLAVTGPASSFITLLLGLARAKSKLNCQLHLHLFSND